MTTVSVPAELLLLLQLFCLCCAPAGAGGWIENSGTASASIVSGSSGENLACPNNAWKAVDGIEDFGCKASHPGHELVAGLHGVPGGWNAGPGGPDKDDFLTFDFGSAKTLLGFRYTGAGDKVHDAKTIVVEVGTSKTGPWTQVATFTGKDGKHGANSWNKVWQEFEFPATTSQHWKWTAKAPRYSQWQIWVGEIQWREPSDWGWWFIALFVGGGSVYLFGGYAYNVKQRGRREIPHQHLWLAVRALVVDGVNWSRSGGRPPMHAASRGASKATKTDKKKEKKEKKDKSGEKAEKKDKKAKKASSGGDGRQRSLDMPLAAAAAAAAEDPIAGGSSGGGGSENRTSAAGTAAGGGGRWLKVPA